MRAADDVLNGTRRPVENLNWTPASARTSGLRATHVVDSSPWCLLIVTRRCAGSWGKRTASHDSCGSD